MTLAFTIHYLRIGRSIYFSFLGGLVLAALLLGAAGTAHGVEFSPEEQDYIAKHPVIRVHNEADWPPFNFNRNGKPQGISIDVMNRIARISGLNITYVTGPSWNTFMDMMKDGTLDIMLNIVDLPERRPFFRFTTPYAKSLTGVFTRNEQVRNYFDFKDLKGRTIALPRGFDLELKMPKYHPEVKLLLVRDTLACIEAVLSGKADAFMEEIGVVDYITSQRMVSDIRLAFQVNESSFISNLTIATTRDNGLLFTIIQKSLNAIPDDELHKIRRKWLLKGVDLYEKSMIRLTVAEKEYVYQHHKIDICVDPSWPPLDFITEDGVHSGVSADLIQKVAKRLGVTLNLIPTKTWDQSLRFLRDGRCQVIPLMNETRETRSYVDFSQPYFDFPTVIAAGKESSFISDYEDLYGKTIALQSHFFITEFVRSHHPQIRIIEVENTREALKLVSGHKAFATIDSLPTIVNVIEALALENLRIVGSVPQGNRMKLGVRKGNDQLLSIFDKGIASLTEKERIGIYKKWLDIEVEDQFYNKSFIIKAAAGAAFLLLFLMWRQITLSRYTRQLKKLNAKLRYAATFDHLTEVFNRKSIEKRLEIEVQKSGLSSEPLTLVILDIDYFKSINDSFGHMKGDMVLKKIAGIVQSSIRKSDHFGRWGGEEFMIILPNTRFRDADRIMNLLRAKIAAYDFGLGHPVTVSMGLGQLLKKEKTPAFLTRVDNCLYTAKERGRNTVVAAESAE